MHGKDLKGRLILIRGAGEMATGVACSLYRANLRRILMLETPAPQAVRRQVSFCEAVHEGAKRVEGIDAVRVREEEEMRRAWEHGKICVRVDPAAESLAPLRPDVFVDAVIAKRNIGTRMGDAPLVVALGPGFTAGRDCHAVVETNRGHNMGRLIYSGVAEANTGIPGDIGGYTRERVLRAPTDGLFSTGKKIGDKVKKGEVVALVEGNAVLAPIGGIIRGLIRPESSVGRGLKIGDIDPREEAGYCGTVSEKARTIGGAVLEAVLAAYNH